MAGTPHSDRVGFLSILIIQPYIAHPPAPNDVAHQAGGHPLVCGPAVDISRGPVEVPLCLSAWSLLQLSAEDRSRAQIWSFYQGCSHCLPHVTSPTVAHLAPSIPQATTLRTNMQPSLPATGATPLVSFGLTATTSPNLSHRTVPSRVGRLRSRSLLSTMRTTGNPIQAPVSLLRRQMT